MQNTLFHHAHVTVEGTSVCEYLSVKRVGAGREASGRDAAGVAESQHRCIGWRFETRRRHRGVLCVMGSERGTFIGHRRRVVLSPLSPPSLVLILGTLITLSGLSTVAIPAVFRRGPVTRGH